VHLVALLEGKCGPEAQEEAAGALFALADHEGNRVAITEANGIGWLVQLLGCDNPAAREHAEGALVRLSIENANRVLIIKKLVDMLQDSGAAAQEQAAAALANLARESEDNRKSIVDANGIVPLLEILDSTSAKAKENSVGAIKEVTPNPQPSTLNPQP
jgi:vacuolar protein 8